MWFFLFKFKSWAIRGNQGQQVNMTAECPARAQTGDLLVVRQTIYLNWESNECYKLILETLFLLQDQPRTLFEKQSHTEPWSEFWGDCSNIHGFVFAEPEPTSVNVKLGPHAFAGMKAFFVLFLLSSSVDWGSRSVSLKTTVLHQHRALLTAVFSHFIDAVIPQDIWSTPLFHSSLCRSLWPFFCRGSLVYEWLSLVSRACCFLTPKCLVRILSGQTRALS